MNELDPLEVLRRRHTMNPGSAQPPAECLDDQTIAALADGTLDAAARAASLPHLADCERCRGAVASVARALADASVARELATAERGPRGRGRWYRLALPAAAAAVLLLLSFPRDADEPEGTHRALPSATENAPVPVSPVGTVADAPTLRWTRLVGADRYRVTLFDVSGAVLYETELGDTVTALPDSVRLVPGRSYLWKVEARTGWDRWSASGLVEFSVAGGGLP